MSIYWPGDYVKVELKENTTGESEWMWVRVEHADDLEQIVLVSWTSGDESAGMNDSHRSRKGNRNMRRILDQSANGAVKVRKRGRLGCIGCNNAPLFFSSEFPRVPFARCAPIDSRILMKSGEIVRPALDRTIHREDPYARFVIASARPPYLQHAVEQSLARDPSGCRFGSAKYGKPQ